MERIGEENLQRHPESEGKKEARKTKNAMGRLR